MNEEYFNQRIRCHVKDCKFYDNKNTKCSLGAITVDNHSSGTYCKSYEKNELE